MEIARIIENKETGKIYGLLGNINLTTNNTNYSIVTEYKFKGTVKEYLNSEKDLSSLNLVMLNEDYLNKKIEDLTESEIKIVSLAKALIENKDYIVLDYFEKGLNDKEKENFKRIFKKLANLNKTIVIFTNDIKFIWEISDNIIYVDKNEVINTIKKNELFNIMDLLDTPEITHFIKLMREKNIDIEDYKDWSDLLKAIYRIKGE